MNHMYSIGIDQSANHTGICVLDDENHIRVLELIEPKGFRGTARLAFIRDELAKILRVQVTLRGERAAIGVWESYSHNSVNQKFLLGEVGGVAQLAIFDHADRVECCAPKALKKFVTGRGDASKDQMMAAIARRWSASITNDNLADAYGLAQLGLTLLNPKRTTLRSDLEVAKGVRKGKKKKSSPYRMRRDVL
jgi:crossover junction endodeoxyribonuclease RuvC